MPFGHSGSIAFTGLNRFSRWKGNEAVRIIDLREMSVPISRYADPSVPSGGLNTSMLALITDVIRDGKPVVGYGFASIGRFAQGGLIRERFAPRLMAVSEADLTDEAGTNLDPFRAWRVMMTNEKPGGHGERCVAVGALDMALWDAAAKIARLPLYRLLMDRTGTPQRDGPRAGSPSTPEAVITTPPMTSLVYPMRYAVFATLATDAPRSRSVALHWLKI